MLLGIAERLGLMDGRFGDCFTLTYHLGENCPSWILRNEFEWLGSTRIWRGTDQIHNQAEKLLPVLQTSSCHCTE